MKEITSHANAYIKMLKSLKLKKFRDEEGLYLIEGQKTILEAFAYGQPVECVVISDKNTDVAREAHSRGVEVLKVPYDVIEQIADTQSPQKELACLRKAACAKDLDGTFYVAMDDVNDPKNLGTILRTADAAGVSAALVSHTSADIYGPKVQRAAMGSTFHINVEVCNLVKRLKELKRRGVRLVAGCLAGADALLASYKSVCVVIGNEARGISPEVMELVDERYRIPIYGRAESLNASVAAGILLYEIRERLEG
ncbi:MAG TPA: 23S rRNA (guanosine(2251)-2'-O)-methyltransferase RlmB [Clostridiales bacterium]|nr:23S rRNA (guanosine(2251)-2'-O)-methyltransferase RlmB [Clostridiales bacterium]